MLNLHRLLAAGSMAVLAATVALAAAEVTSRPARGFAPANYSAGISAVVAAGAIGR